MNYATHILLFCAITFICSCSTPSKIADSSSTADAKNLLQIVNDIRGKGCKCGGIYMPPVQPLKRNHQLDIAAREHCEYMNRKQTLSHIGVKKSTPATRVTNAGYKWRFVAENIAMGPTSIKEVILNWLNSTGHCKNIMNKSATEMGYAKSGSYWTLVLAAPQ